MEQKRNFIAIILICIIVVLTPKWMSLFGPKQIIDNDDSYYENLENSEPLVPLDFNKPNKGFASNIKEKKITIVTDLYEAVISNKSGGSIVSYKLKKFFGSYDLDQNYNDSINVELINDNNASGCMPCIKYKDNISNSIYYFNDLFSYLDKDTIFVSGENTYDVNFTYKSANDEKINKIVTIKGNSYTINHSFYFEDFDFSFSDELELCWLNGLLPTEKIEAEDIQNASFVASFGQDYEKFYYTSPDSVELEVVEGNASWIGINNKYFLMSIIPENRVKSFGHSYGSLDFKSRKITPSYNAFLAFSPSNNFSLTSKIYLGPLEYNTLKLENVGLENAISFGWAIIQPFTKGILFVLMFLKEYINNYGLVLILFAFIVRIVTGPLTKKAAISSQKMQSIQPKLQKIQKKYKNNPQKLNAETIALYRDNGVNPLGGCLPILIQMPLLFSLFLVFRTTIEFRGAKFFGWIQDLSQPDMIFELPFSIPLYGSYVCLLPLLMSITMFIQQSYTMAKNVDKNTKIMMQSMSVVFFLIFNTFPSGLNLYYTVTNILSIFQQRSIKKNLTS